MVAIDLAVTPVREANQRIRALAAEGHDIDIVNPDARHHIGVGLVTPTSVRIHGSAGYFCAGLSDGARFEVDNNVGWAVGDNMHRGSVVVGGNASAIAGVAIRGAEIVIRGNMGSRGGQVMKAGTLCCAGNASFLAGYMMYGGRIIILGDSGERVGEDMTGGTIYVGGRIVSLGADARETDLPAQEQLEILEFLDRYGISFHGSLSRIENAGTKLRYGTPEPRSRPQPYERGEDGSVATGYWNRRVREDIAIKAQIGRYRIRGYGASKPMPDFGDIAFARDVEPGLAHPDPLAAVSLETTVGSRSGAKPLGLSMPVMIAPMSYGALSRSMKVALAVASRLSGVAENTGEGGMLDRQREEADQLIYQCLSGRLGWNVHDMQRADAIEFYASQGAKPGLGGQLMAKKVTPELAAMRGIPQGIDLRSPSRHPDVLGADDLVIKIEEFREATAYRLPIGLKMGAGRVQHDIKIAYKDGFDYVALDGVQGGTGAASTEVLENVGIPTLAAIQEAMDGLKEIDAGSDMDIVLMGGIKDGVDVVKALALGARACAMGTSLLIAAGCIACMQCHVGACPVGIATQDPDHEQRLEVRTAAEKIHRYLETVRWQIAALTLGLGHTDVRQLGRSDLVALTPEAAALTGLPYVPKRAATAA